MCDKGIAGFPLVKKGDVNVKIWKGGDYTSLIQPPPPFLIGPRLRWYPGWIQWVRLTLELSRETFFFLPELIPVTVSPE